MGLVVVDVMPLCRSQKITSKRSRDIARAKNVTSDIHDVVLELGKDDKSHIDYDCEDAIHTPLSKSRAQC